MVTLIFPYIERKGYFKVEKGILQLIVPFSIIREKTIKRNLITKKEFNYTGNTLSREELLR